MRPSRKVFVLGCLSFLLAAVGACTGETTCGGASCGDGASESPGRHVPCESDAACDTQHGFACIAGTCLYACDSHFDCSAIGLCQSFDRGSFCAPSAEQPPPGQYYTRCENGTECDAAAGFSCIGAGVGDLDAYCTADCAGDADCPTGFFCESTGVTPCEDVCNVIGDPNDPACVPASEIGDGQRYRCTPVGPVRDQCVKRRFCAECETDEDCRSTPGLICARDLSGAKICTTPCDLTTGSCPWGNAAVCRVTDDERGIATCSHRFGSCRGEGNPCEPCARDQDCRETGFCYGSSFTGERYCIDFAEAGQCNCTGETIQGGVCQGGGCPLTPGQLEMLCLVRDEETLDGVCYAANSNDNPLLGSPQTGCWGPI